MVAWEYFLFRSDSLSKVLNGSAEPGDLVELNRLGREGWELVWIETSAPFTLSLLFFSTNRIHRIRTFYLRRAIEKKTWS